MGPDLFCWVKPRGCPGAQARCGSRSGLALCLPVHRQLTVPVFRLLPRDALVVVLRPLLLRRHLQSRLRVRLPLPFPLPLLGVPVQPASVPVVLHQPPADVSQAARVAPRVVVQRAVAFAPLLVEVAVHVAQDTEVVVPARSTRGPRGMASARPAPRRRTLGGPYRYRGPGAEADGEDSEPRPRDHRPWVPSPGGRRFSAVGNRARGRAEPDPPRGG